MGQIIDFKSIREKKEVEEFENDVQTADDLAYDIMDELNEILMGYSFVEERDENFAKNYFFVFESLRSLIYGYMNIHHSFQEVVDEMIDTTYNDDSNTYDVYWKEDRLMTADKEVIQKILDSTEDSD